MGECEDDSDCIDQLTGVLKECYEEASFSDETFFCECSPWYGFVGEECNELTGQNIFYTIIMIFMGLWCLFIAVAIIRTILYHFLYGVRMKGVDPVVFTAGYILISVGFVFANSMINISAALGPGNFEIISYDKDLITDGEEFVTAKGGKFSAYALIIGAGCVALASLQIFVSWQAIAVKASSFSSERTQLVAANTLIAIKGFVVLYTFLLVITTATDQISLASFIVVMFALSLAVGYPCAFLVLQKTFENLQVDGNEYVKTMISLIRYCCKVNAISLLLSGLSLTIFFVFYANYQLYLTPGSFNYIVLFRDFGSFSGLLQLTVMSWYINSVANRAKMKTSSLLWNRWDSHHDKLLTRTASKRKNQTNLLTSAE